MKLDLRKDFEEISAYLVHRVQTFDPKKNAGPGKEEEPVAMIDFGFQCDQDGWVALVFDTRPDAEPDGEWNSYIEENLFARPHWQQVLETLETKAVDVIRPDGTKRKITGETELAIPPASWHGYIRSGRVEPPAYKQHNPQATGASQ